MFKGLTEETASYPFDLVKVVSIMLDSTLTVQTRLQVGNGSTAVGVLKDAVSKDGVCCSIISHLTDA